MRKKTIGVLRETPLAGKESKELSSMTNLVAWKKTNCRGRSLRWYIHLNKNKEKQTWKK